MTVTDWEDDRIMVIDNPDGWAAWDGRSGQYVRHPELMKTWVLTNDIIPGKSERWRQTRLGPFSSPEWLEKKSKTATRIT
jgi:hypothetical protein